MTDGSHGEDGFVPRLAARPEIVREAARLIADQDGAVDARLRARRLVEDELGAGPDGIPEWDFRLAAGQLRDAGHEQESAALADIANTSGLLAEVSREWHGRYLGRPPTVAEENDTSLLNTGQVRILERTQTPGCDGALYVPARLEVAAAGGTRLAVVVTNHAGAEEVVTGFAHEYAYDAWLADRGIREANLGPGPLRSAADGPWCRTAREELVLAFLTQGCDLGRDLGPVPGSGFAAGAGAGLRASMFSTYARSELFLACQAVAQGTGRRGSGGPYEIPAELVMRELERRMLRAPGWAAWTVGWPSGDLALSYAWRLALTPVTAVAARTAARELIREDSIATRNAHRRQPASRSSWQLARPRPAPDQATRLSLPRQQPPDGQPPGPAPRM